MPGQDGLALVRQLLEVGVPRGFVRSRVARGEWEQPCRGVVGFAGMPFTWRRRCRLALLQAKAGVALGHATAARLHGFDGYDRDERVMVSFHTGTPPRSMAFDITGVRAEPLRPAQCQVVNGLRTVIRPVALVQVAAMDGVDARLPRSWFQRLVKSHEPRTRHHRRASVRDLSGVLLAELDLAIPSLQIGVECQSWRWHATPAAQAHDNARKRALRMIGWDLVEVWWSDLDRIDEIALELQLLVERRSAERSRPRPGCGSQEPQPGQD